MSGKHLFYILAIIVFMMLVWSYIDKPKNTTAQTPTIGTQNQPILQVAEAIKGASHYKFYNPEPTQKEVIDAIKAHIFFSGIQGRTAYLEAYLAQLVAIQRKDPIKCGELIFNPSKYPPNVITQLLDQSAKQKTLSALSQVLEDAGNLPTDYRRSLISTPYKFADHAHPATMYTPTNRLEDKYTYLCHITIRDLQSFLKQPTDHTKAELVYSFSDYDNRFGIFVF